MGDSKENQESTGDVQETHYAAGESHRKRYTTADVMRVFERAPVPLLTAPDVAEELGCSAPTARDRLDELAEGERVYRKTVGARAVVYALLEDGQERQSGYGPWKRSLWDDDHPSQ